LSNAARRAMVKTGIGGSRWKFSMASRAPFRADEVGSLLRPAELKEARAASAEGRIDADALRAIEDRLIREVVAKQ
jgi:hypothetical protein